MEMGRLLSKSAEAGVFALRLARDDRDLRAAQRLRYRVFVEELGADGPMVDHAARLSEFMAYFGGNLAREIARLTGWKDKVWSRRYESILITNEESAQVERLAYVLSNTVKENLVARVEE